MVQPVIDIGILTIRDDEFRAVLAVFKDGHDVYKGRHREYTLRTADAGHGARYRVAILRQVEQGNGEAQEAARDLIDDLEPSLLLVVGIAGGLPSDDITLGDIVLSTRVHDFSLEARKFQEGTTYNVGGGPISKAIAAGIANLGGREEELGDWWAELPDKPPVNFTPTKLYGPAPWKRTLRGKLQVHYGNQAEERPPIFSAGPIASSDRLVKDPKLLFPWITTARGILAIEMESAGVHRATRERTSMLSIRGLSDLVGLKRHDAWTKYACASAAAFTRAYLRTQPVPLRETQQAGAPPAPSNSAVDTSQQEAAVEESFANLIPLQHFPDTIYVAPALTKTRKQAWAQLKRHASRKNPDYVPSSWTIQEDNLYSLIDPEESRLKTIIDIGAVEQFNAEEWAFSADQNRRRLFVQLLNAAVREDLWSQGVRHHGDQDVYAFIGRLEDPPRQLRYSNLKVRSTSTVVQHYDQKAKNGKVYTYLRHAAFQGRFRLLGGAWYLEITPTYRFTYNGKDLDNFHEERLSGIKRFERNRSVVSQLLLWQAVLRGPWPRADRSRRLEFGPLVSFRFTPDLNENFFSALDPPANGKSGEKDSEE